MSPRCRRDVAGMSPRLRAGIARRQPRARSRRFSSISAISRLYLGYISRRFIDESLESGAVVFVHCGAGISRAPTAAAAYLIWKLRMPAAAALNLIKRSRKCIRPNTGLVVCLKVWERACLAAPDGHVPTPDEARVDPADIPA